MTRMPLAQCPCDDAHQLRHRHHPGVCFPNTRTSRHFRARCININTLSDIVNAFVAKVKLCGIQERGTIVLFLQPTELSAKSRLFATCRRSRPTEAEDSRSHDAVEGRMLSVFPWHRHKGISMVSTRGQFKCLVDDMQDEFPELTNDSAKNEFRTRFTNGFRF